MQMCLVCMQSLLYKLCKSQCFSLDKICKNYLGKYNCSVHKSLSNLKPDIDVNKKTFLFNKASNKNYKFIKNCHYQFFLLKMSLQNCRISQNASRSRKCSKIAFDSTCFPEVPCRGTWCT